MTAPRSGRAGLPCSIRCGFVRVVGVAAAAPRPKKGVWEGLCAPLSQPNEKRR